MVTQPDSQLPGKKKCKDGESQFSKNEKSGCGDAGPSHSQQSADQTPNHGTRSDTDAGATSPPRHRGGGDSWFMDPKTEPEIANSSQRDK